MNAKKNDCIELKLVGGDKVNNRRSYKLKYAENDKNYWSIWLNIVDDDKKFDSKLLKASYSHDNFDSDYGELAINYQIFGECIFPTEINLVYGLSEKKMRQINIEKVSMVNINE